MPYHVGQASAIGCRERPDFVDYGGIGAAKLCSWHRLGTPIYAQGGDWAVLGCPECEKKKAAGKVTANAPTPMEFARSLKRSRFTAKHAHNADAAAKRRAFYAAMPVRETP